MSAEMNEEAQLPVCEESAVCVGDGTTCVECGKVFTHPFYFGTHISTHMSQKDFVAVGQCALCGLVFSNAAIFTAHLSSSQSRLETQVTPEDDNEAAETYSDTNRGFNPENDPGNAEDPVHDKNDVTEKPGTKANSPPPSEQAPKEDQEGTNSNNDEPRLKRKRKAPQRFEVDSRPHVVQTPTDADPEVEAYLLSLKQMGLTVDPAAFSSHKGGKRRRKTSESGGVRAKGRKEFGWAGEFGNLPPDFQMKTSPKYEYLDSDDSFDEDIEVLPQSGKLTRGERLQQRLERLSQVKEQGPGTGTKKGGNVKLEITDVKSECDTETASAGDGIVNAVPNTDTPVIKSEIDTAAKKPAQPIPNQSFVAKRENTSVTAPVNISNLPRTPLGSASRGRAGKNIGHRAVPQPNLGKVNAVRFPFVKSPIKSSFVRTPQLKAPPISHFAGKSNQYRTFPMPGASGNMFPAHSAGIASNIGQGALRFQHGGGRGRKGDAMRPSVNMNVQKSSSLEDLKKNSRDNVEQMLQNVGMMAVTSTAVGQGKLFSTQKVKCGEIAFPPVRSMGSFGLYRPTIPHRGFPNKPYTRPETMLPQHRFSNKGQTRFLPKPVSARGQAGGTSAAWGPRGRQLASPSVPAAGGFSYPQSVGHGRGVGAQRGRGQHLHGNIRGSVKGNSSNTPIRGKSRPVPSAVVPRGGSRGRASSVNKQAKPASEIIVIDDDDIQEAPSGNTPSKSKSLDAQKSSQARTNTGKVSILDVDLDSGVSDIKVIEDKTQESSPAAEVRETGDNSSLEKPSPSDNDNSCQEGNNSEAELDSSKSIRGEAEVKSGDTVAEHAECSEHAKQNNLRIKKTDRIHDPHRDTEYTEIMTGEDIDGWKVCLAENSDSNEDDPSALAGTLKTSGVADQHLSSHNSPGESNSSLPAVQSILEVRKQDDSSNECMSPNSESVQGPCESSEDVLEKCASESLESTNLIENVSSEPQDKTKSEGSSDVASDEGGDTHNDGEAAAVDPDGSEAVGSKPESPSKRTIAEGLDNIVSEHSHECLPLSSIDMKEADAEYGDGDDAGGKLAEPNLPLNAATTSIGNKTIEERKQCSNLSQDNSSFSLPPDDSVSSDRDSLISERVSGRLKEGDLSDRETEEKKRLVTNEDESSATASVRHEGSSNKNETSSFSPLSENETHVERNTKDSYDDESHTDEAAISSTLICSNNVESLNGGTVPQQSSPSQTSAAASAGFLKEGNSLLDIFTEIEKTCKEMEESLVGERENCAASQSEDRCVNKVVSDISGNSEGVEVNTEKDTSGYSEGPEDKNGKYASGYSDGVQDGKVCLDEENIEGNKEDEVKHGSSGDGSVDNMDEDIEGMRETEKELAGGSCRRRNEMVTNDNEHGLSEMECQQERQHVSEGED